MAFEKYTVTQFRRAWFGGDRSVMDEDEFSKVYNEYIDISGQFKTEEFDRVAAIHYMSDRRNSVALAIKLQREFIKEFEVPFIENFEYFKKKGFHLKWKNSIPDFLSQLNKVEDKEKKWIPMIENKIKELNDFRKKKQDKKVSTVQSEASFVKMINQIRKNGWQIDPHKDTVEDLAYIVKQQLEEQN